MNIPLVDQDLATIKAVHVQYVNGYHLSKADYVQYVDALNRITEESNAILRDYIRDYVKEDY